MRFGTPDEIRAGDDYCLQWAKPGGGYIFCTANRVYCAIPMESYE
jgi:hypothetical protein